MVKTKEFKRISGYRYQRMTNTYRSKSDLNSLAQSYRIGSRLYDGKKAKSVRIVKVADGYILYVR